MKLYSAVWEKKKILSRILKAKTEEKVLDFGAGNGAYLPVLLNYFNQVYALENDRDRINQLKNQFGKNDKVKLVFCQGGKLPFKDNFFDLVWVSEVLEHQKDFSLVEEWERVGRNLLVITVPNPSGPYWPRDKSHLLFYSLASLNHYFLSRKKYSYQIYGLGFCWPAGFGFDFLRRIFLALSWKRPGLAWSWLVLGRKLNIAD